MKVCSGSSDYEKMPESPAGSSGSGGVGASESAAGPANAATGDLRSPTAGAAPGPSEGTAPAGSSTEGLAAARKQKETLNVLRNVSTGALRLICEAACTHYRTNAGEKTFRREHAAFYDRLSHKRASKDECLAFLKKINFTVR